MSLRIILKLSLKEIFASKLRSFLTMLGVIVGVFSIILIVSLGRGATSSITSDLEKQSNIISINIMTDKKAMTYEDMMKFYKEFNVKNVSPIIQVSGEIKKDSITGGISIQGIGDEYSKIKNEELENGRHITPLDVDYRSKVIVLNNDAKNKYFKGKDPIGQFVQINGDSYKVIGVLAKKDMGFFGYVQESGYIPVTTAQIMSHQRIKSISVNTESKDDVNNLVKQLHEGLTKYYGEKPKNQNQQEAVSGGYDSMYGGFGNEVEYFRINTAESALKQVNNITNILSIMLGGIASISLLVGGIGIMNIMFVSVSERTREIGIRKSLGAQRRDILIQFLIEASVVSGVGGIIGIILAQIGIKIASALSPIHPVMGMDIAAGSFVFSLLIGVVFGVYPAYKAAKLKPIDALRAE
ncbi:ABC transporter permease [Clostridiaceae bacterium M8S5]|nr:ABC transporter permease [Clostridiaceae bacterium M8S5]